MDKQHVAIVLPEEWVDFRDDRGEPIFSTEMRDELDKIEEAHPQLAIHFMFHGSFEDKFSNLPRLIVAASGVVLPMSAFRAVEGRDIGEDLGKVLQTGLLKTTERVLTTYSRRYHPEFHS